MYVALSISVQVWARPACTGKRLGAGYMANPLMPCDTTQ